jgi:hypothetical protein
MLGSIGTNGAAGLAGVVITETGDGAGNGGTGGDGGPGGTGGNGGNGGPGGGGSGGTINLAADSIVWGASYALEVTGGDGATNAPGSTNAPSGIIRWRSDFNGASNIYSAPTSSSVNPYLSYSEAILILGETDLSSYTPNVTNLVGGADTFGVMANDTNSSIAGTDMAALIYLIRAYGDIVIQQNAIGVVVRANQSVISSMSASTNTPQLFFVNLADAPLRNPAVAANRPNDQDLVPGPIALQTRGYALNPLIVPGAPGAQALSNLLTGTSWTSLLHPGDSLVTASFTPYANPETVSRLTTQADTRFQYLWLLDTGLPEVSVLGLPANLVSLPATADRSTNTLYVYPQARAGGGGTNLTVVINNVGNPSSLMSSLTGSDATFTNLGNGTEVEDTWLVGDTNSYGTQPPVTFQVATDAGTINVVATATTIGPIMNGSVSAADAGGTLTFNAWNNYTFNYSSPSPPPSYLYGLDILGITISGQDATYFSLSGPTNGIVPLLLNESGTTNSPWTDQINFTAHGPRIYHATLNVQTDEAAEQGQPGYVLSYALTVQVAPTLAYTFQNGTLTLSWLGSGYELQQTTNLNPPVFWNDVPSGDVSGLTIAPGTSQAYFRLRPN